jgi:uncharacterized membrane protein YphA (DoxX/SURF4 family)
MRLVLGTSLLANGIERFQAGQSAESMILNLLTASAGMLLIAGLWTPVAGSLVVVVAIWSFFAQQASLSSIVLFAAIGAGLALVGPGMWSLDARLFGWKRIDLED